MLSTSQLKVYCNNDLALLIYMYIRFVHFRTYFKLLPRFCDIVTEQVRIFPFIDFYNINIIHIVEPRQPGT